MRILNFGSLNTDHVYQVDHFVRPGETLDSRRYERFPGGKGLNQSIALAAAGAAVCHAGKIGHDGLWLRETLRHAGVDVSPILVSEEPGGHAMIQVNREGENAIVLYGGSNRTLSPAEAEAAIVSFQAGDVLLIQNEISSIPEIMAMAARKGMQIVFNPAPMQDEVRRYPLERVRCFVVNEIEGGDLTGEREPERILAAMRARYPSAATVLTLGGDGVLYGEGGRTVRVPAVKVRVVDTTAAGDTFIGYFLAGWTAGEGLEDVLARACRAAALCVTRPGAAVSIPRRDEVESWSGREENA